MIQDLLDQLKETEEKIAEFYRQHPELLELEMQRSDLMNQLELEELTA